jgi:hypothetical protein
MEDIDLTADRFRKLWDRNNPDNAPWMQREDEADLWYGRFKDFVFQGPSRSVLQCVQKWRREKNKNERNSIPQSWTDAKRRNDWLNRASLFDQAVDEIKNDVWSVRQAEIVDRDWEMAEELHERFKKMLAFPLQVVTKDTKKQGTNVIERTIIRPANWSQSTMIRIARAASELGRLAVGMPTEHTERSGDEEKVIIYIPANNREKEDVTDKEENAESDN